MNGTDRLYGICREGPMHQRMMSSLFREVEMYRIGRYVWAGREWQWKYSIRKVKVSEDG